MSVGPWRMLRSVRAASQLTFGVDPEVFCPAAGCGVLLCAARLSRCQGT